MTNTQILGKRAAFEILNKGLSESTFRDNFPEAYIELIYYEKDIAASITKTLNASDLIAESMKI